MKAVFMDYTGTTVQEKGPEIEEAIMRIWKNSSLSGPEEALEVSGCSPSEAIHIGDSYSSDALGAMSAGICPILVQRKKKEPHADVICVGSLEEVLTLSFFTQEEIS